MFPSDLYVLEITHPIGVFELQLKNNFNLLTKARMDWVTYIRTSERKRRSMPQLNTYIPKELGGMKQLYPPGRSKKRNGSEIRKLVMPKN